MSELVETYRSKDGSITTSSRDGVDWMDAPRPFFLHRCFVQTEGWINYFTQVWRCSCGGICMPQRGRRHIWLDKNSRRK